MNDLHMTLNPDATRRGTARRASPLMVCATESKPRSSCSRLIDVQCALMLKDAGLIGHGLRLLL